MQAIELAKHLFQNHEIRIFGTVDRPLFIASDVTRILGLKNTSEAIVGFDDFEKDDISIPDVTGRMQQTVALTEPGLYSLVLKSRKPIAKEFKKWLLGEVLPAIRKTGKYEAPVHTEQSSATFPSDNSVQQSSSSDEQIIASPSLPHGSMDFWDLSIFNDKPCVYLFHLCNDDYKFGQTSEIIKRENAHRNDFRKYGCEIAIVNLWACPTVKCMRDAEARIKTMAKTNGWFSPKYDKHEIITCPNIEFIIARIDAFIEEQNTPDERAYQLRMRKLDIVEMRIQADERKRQTDIRMRELDIEFYKLQHSIPQTITAGAPERLCVQQSLPATTMPVTTTVQQNLPVVVHPVDIPIQSVSAPIVKQEPPVQVVSGDMQSPVTVQPAAPSVPSAQPTVVQTAAQVLTCAKCHQTKAVSGFRASRAAKTGYESKCLACRSRPTAPVLMKR